MSPESVCMPRMVLALCIWLGGSVTAAAQAVPAPAPEAWHRLQRAAWVAQGAPHPEHLLYVITDANCPFCHELWELLQPFYGRGVQVRYVMVGILAPDSPGKAAAILEARNPAAALNRNERHWAQLPQDPGGGISPVAHPKAATIAALDGNARLMADLAVRGTPAVIYRDAAQTIQVIRSAFTAGKLQSIVRAASPD